MDSPFRINPLVVREEATVATFVQQRRLGAVPEMADLGSIDAVVAR